MITLTEAHVDSLALNASAIKNGRDLVKKKSFTLLNRSEDDTLLFAECKGSGKEPYRCSADFIKPDSPVFRCSCPSRQFPCKHLLGLMYAYAQGQPFTAAEVPQDIAEKREKLEKREEKKKAVEAGSDSEGSSDKPRKRQTNKAALAKKIRAQLEGIEIADKLLQSVVQSGLGVIDGRTLKTLEDQVKGLGNYYIAGIQSAFRSLLLALKVDEDREAAYTKAIPQLTAIYSLIKKSREHLISRLDNPEQVIMDTTTTLEEAIGHAWQLAELREHGLTEQDAELLQLAYRSYADQSRDEFIDEGHWIELGTGRIFMSRTYRPYRAAKHIREDDSFFAVAQPKELAIYPGEMNRRARWEEAAFRDPTAEDYSAIQAKACRSIAEAVKLVKNQIKNPLSDKHPALLLAFREIADAGDGKHVLVDEQGKGLTLSDIAYLDEPAAQLLPLLKQEDLRNQAMLVMFEHDPASSRLTAQPLSIVTEQGVIRLMY